MMTEDEFNTFTQLALRELESKQKALTYSLRSCKRCKLEEKTSKLLFADENNQPQTEALVTPIGEYNELFQTWRWGWDLHGLDKGMVKKAEQLKRLYQYTGLEMFQRGQIDITEEHVDELLAMSIYQLSSQGYIRLPRRNPRLYMSVDEILIYTRPL